MRDPVASARPADADAPAPVADRADPELDRLTAEDPGTALHVERARWLSAELVRVRSDLAAAQHDLAEAEGALAASRRELERLRRGPVMRVARLLRRRDGSRPEGPARKATRPPSPLDPRGPGGYRRDLLARLGGADDAPALRVAVVGLDAGADPADLAGPAWVVERLTGPAIDGLDVLVSFDADHDAHATPDGTILAAVVDGDDAERWLGRPWFDTYDLVLTTSDAAREILAAGSVHQPIVGPADVGDRAALRAVLQDALRTWVTADRIDLAIGPPDQRRAENWGDYHFGRAMQRALQRRGHPTRVRFRNQWTSGAARHADAVVHICGLRERPTDPAQVNVLWIISHPTLVTDAQVAANDLVYAASDRFASDLADRTGRRVGVLHQAADPQRFRPMDGGPAHQVLIVAGRRSERRPTVDELTPTPLDLAVYGHGWTADELAPRHHRGDHVPNDRLAAYYAAADIVLNDHWADMLEWGFMTNRLYDAAASGAFVLSDHLDEIEDEFDGGIATYRDGPDLRRQVARYLADPDARASMARRAREAVLARHTFDHRAATLLEDLEPLLAARRAAVDGRG
jgi:hypothetical protein